MKAIILIGALALAAAPAYGQAAASLSPAPRMQFFDTSGRPLAGGCIQTFAAGSTTPLATYSNAAGTANQNPVILDAYGRADIWLGAGTAYKITVRAKTTGCAGGGGAILYTTDNVIDQGFALANSLAAGTLAIGLRASPATGAGGGIGPGNALLSATTTGLYVSVNGGAPVQLNGGGGGGGGSAAGPVSAIQYNTGSGFGGSANFGWNNSGMVMTICAPPATGCTNTSGIQSPAFSSTATGTNPAFVSGGGAAVIYGNGDATLQTITANTVFNSKSQGAVAAVQQYQGRFVINGDGNGYFQNLCVAGDAASETCNYGFTSAGVLTVASCVGCGGGAGGAAGPTNSVQYNTGTGLGGSTNFTWNNVGFVLNICGPPATGCTNNSGIQAPAYSSTLTGAGNPAYVAGGGAGVIYANGDATFQTVTATTVFKSISTLKQPAFTQQSQQFQINGDGNAYFQWICSKGNPNTETCTYGLDPNGVLTVSSCTGCGGGGAGSAEGPATSVQFNTGAGFGGSANLIWNNTGDVLTICPAPATGCTSSSGIQSPAFSSSAAGVNPAYVAGNGAGQINGDGKAYFQYLCTSGNASAETCTYGLSGAGVLTVASCTGCGGVASWNTRTGAVTLTKADVTAVTQALGTGDSPQFSAITVGGGLYGLAANGVLTVSSCSGCSAGSVTSWNSRTGAVSLTKQDVTNVEGQGLGNADNVSFNAVSANTHSGGTFSGTVFNCTTAGTANCFQQASGQFQIHGSGWAAFQDICVVAANPAAENCTYGWNNQGDMWAHNIFAASVNAPSDVRLKENIRNLPDSLAGILKLRPVTFDWKKDHQHGIGFIAQEVRAQFPELVTDDQKGYLGLNQIGMIPELVKAIQQLTARVALLEARK